MVTPRHLNIGPEDNVTEIDVNADGKTDVYVITDNPPQRTLQVDTIFPFGGGSEPDPDLDPFARTWRDRLVRP